MAKRRKKNTRLTTEQRFKAFVERALELSKLRAIEDGLQSSYNLTWSADSSELRMTSREPDEEDFRSFLLLFRQFISDNELVFANRIFNDCIRFIRDDKLKEQVQKARDAWRNAFCSSGIAMHVDGTELTPEYVIDLWINGHYFHNDADKAAELKELLGQPLQFVRMQLMTALPLLLNSLFYLSGVIGYGLKNGLFEFPDDEAH